MDDGTIGSVSGGTNTYSLDTAYTLYMILNDTGSVQSYDGGSLAANSAAIWIEEIGGSGPVYAGSLGLNNSQSSAYRVSFRTFTGDIQNMYIDNASFYTGAAAVPEVRSTMLALIGLAVLLRRRR